jgi:hypothetical protein
LLLQIARRAALGMIVGAAAIAATPAPSEAAYGETAKIFGSITNASGLGDTLFIYVLHSLVFYFYSRKIYDV